MQTNLNRENTYLLACSYGPDSMALFGLLLKEKIRFSVAHVNYQMRGAASEQETKDLIAFCKKHHIQIDVMYVDGHSFSGNFQAEARKVRYEYFASLINKYGHAALLTAHHRDDFLETYLMQVSSRRQSFYYGIKSEVLLDGMRVLRPLLNVYKEDLVKYCDDHLIPYAIDQSNLHDTYTRNKVRHQKIGKMSRHQKEVLYDEIAQKNQQIMAIENRLLETFDLKKIDISQFLSLNLSEQEALLFLLFSYHHMQAFFSKNRAQTIITLVNHSRQSIFMKVYKHLYFSKYEAHFSLIDMDKYQTYRYVIKAPTRLETPQFTLNLKGQGANQRFSLDDYPLFISPAQPGDKYKIKTYKKAINRMYIDMKMPRHLRFIWPVVKNKDGDVIYVPRYRKDYVSQPNDVFIMKQIL